MLQQLQTGALGRAFMTMAEVTSRYVDTGALYLVKHMDTTIGSYIEKGAGWPAQVQAMGKAYTKVDAAFFGSMVGDWSAIWSEKAPSRAKLRAVAEASR